MKIIISSVIENVLNEWLGISSPCSALMLFTIVEHLVKHKFRMGCVVSNPRLCTLTRKPNPDYRTR